MNKWIVLLQLLGLLVGVVAVIGAGFLGCAAAQLNWCVRLI